MKHLIKVLYTVLRKIIIPHYDMLVDVEITEQPENTLIVRYYYKSHLPQDVMNDIFNETHALFNMLETENYRIIVNFRFTE